MPVPTRRLAVLAAALSAAVVALPLALPLSLVLVDGLLLLVALVDWRLAAPPSSLSVERSLPAVIELGATGTVRWRVGNPTDRALEVALADELAPSLGATSRRADLLVPAGGAAEASAELRPSRRGRFEPATIDVRVTGPLGLAARQGVVVRPGALRVHPRYASRALAAARLDRARVLEVGLRSAQGRGQGTEFEALREHAPDDETRRIDWAATARAGRTIVRTYRAERDQRVLCLLDLGRTMAARVADVPRVEHAMDAVLLLTHVAGRLGDRVGVLAYDREVRAVVPPRAGPDQLRRVTEALFDLEPRLVEPDHRLGFTAALSRFRRRALVVVCTELDQAAEEGLLPALPLLVRTHLVVVASTVDPQLLRWATARPADAEAAYRRAAAVTALADRRALAARLRSAGATVVDEPPGSLAPALADAYLRGKAVGRL